MRRLLGLLTLLLASCQSVPTPTVEVVELPVRQFVPIDPELTRDCPIAEGPIAAVLDVSRERKKALEVCNDQLRRIRALQPLED